MNKHHSDQTKAEDASHIEGADIKRSPLISPTWDHEIEQSSQTYDDALFCDDNALNKALKQSKTLAKQTITRQAETQVQQNPTTPVVEVDFTQFLTPGSITGNSDTGKNNAGKETSPGPTGATIETHLQTVAIGVNHTLLAKDINEPPANPFVIKKTESALPLKKLDQAAPGKPTNIIINTIINTIKTAADQTKTQFDDYFGRTLPTRELALEFPSTPLKAKKEFENIPSAASIRKFCSYKTSSALTVFKKADEILADIVKCDLNHTNKLALLDTYSPFLSAKILNLINSLQRKPSVPGDIKRLETTTHALNAMKNLIIGYRQIYAKLYELPNYFYAPQRTKINRCAYRLIDLLYLEQCLSTSLQRSLPAGSTKLMNKLYTALALYEPELLKQPLHSLSLNTDSSINTLFTVYQLIRCIDMMSLSTLQHVVVHRYIQNTLPLLSVKFSHEITEISGFWLKVTHTNVDSLALIDTLNDNSEPCAYIWLHPLLHSITNDFNECLNTIGRVDNKHSSPVFATLSNKQALAIISVVNLSVYNLRNQKQATRFTAHQKFKQKAYSELSNVSAYLTNYYHQLSESPRVKDEPVKNAVAKPQVSINQWLLAMEDEQTIYLQTTESRSNVKLDVGELVLFVNYSDDEQEQEQHQLAYISRMERIQNDKLNLVMHKLGDKIAPVTLQGATTKPFPGLITQRGQQRCLIIQNNQNTFTGQTLTATLPDNNNAVLTIDKLEVLSHRLQVLNLL